MKKTLGQLFRYGIVGVASNLVGYFLYLGLTRLGLGPKAAMTLLYGVGVAQTFIFNKNWTFAHEQNSAPALFRYCASYGLGYLINLAALIVAVDHWGWQHQWVQGVMIVCLAVFLFAAQKFWVFRAP
jgi:putative flippase GtrA